MASLWTLFRLLFQTGGKIQMLPLGTKAPNFTAQTHEGKPLSLIDPVSYTHLTLPTNREV